MDQAERGAGPLRSVPIPGSGEESVWDYPRPPRVEKVADCIRVVFADMTIAESTRTRRVLETASPPVYYIPPEGVQLELLHPAEGRTRCEWKGLARYWDVRVGDRVSDRAAWSYAEPSAGFEEIAGFFAFFAAKMDACFVGGEQVKPQPGPFYGGWITSNILGPFKGEPGTLGW